MKFELSRIKKVLEALGNPQNTFPSIHIAGTNGKGSVAALLASVFKEKGLNTGLYTSPHLIRIHERFRINGRAISNDSLALFVEKLKSALTTPPLQGTFLTQFEFLTVLSFMWFESEKINVAVVETGLGGRLDATNVMGKVVCSIITTIDFDHTEWLGETLPEIAREKAGILKTHIPLVTASGTDVYSILKEEAMKIGSPLHTVDLSEDLLWNNKPFPTKLKGDHQKQNTCLALKTLKVLNNDFGPFSEACVKKGLEEMVWPGRYQKIQLEMNKKKIPVVLDGAHNPGAIKALLATFQSEGIEKFNLVFGVLKDKNYLQMVRLLAPFVNKGYVVPLTTSRSALPSDLARIPEWREKITPLSSLDQVFEFMEREEARIWVVGGSLYLVGAFLGHPKMKDFGISIEKILPGSVGE